MDIAESRVAQSRNLGRDVWIWPWLQDVSQDVRFAARIFAKDRRFSLAVVVALALGIAANTTVFTFISAALFKDLPFEAPGQLVALATRNARGQALQVLWLFMRRTMVHLATGLAIGLAGALAVGRLLQVVMRDTNPRDPLTLACVAFLLVGVAMTASFLPAWRAARLDPVAALRHE